MTETWFKRNVVAIVGFAVNLIVLGVGIGKIVEFISTQREVNAAVTRRLDSVEERVRQHHEDTSMHTTSEWRMQMQSTLSRVEGKLDAHIMGEK